MAIHAVLMGALTITLAAQAPPGDLGPRCDALYEEAASSLRSWSEAQRLAPTPEEAAKAPRPDGAAYARRFLAMARERPDDPAAPRALARAMMVDPFGEGWAAAFEALAKHAGSPEVREILGGPLAFDMTRPGVEDFLRRVMADNPSERARAAAARALAIRLGKAAEEARHLRDHPDVAGRVAERDGEPEMRRFRDRDPEALDREAVAILERLGRDHGGVVFDERRGLTFGDEAAALLRDRLELVAGREAPEITGVDADGRAMSLSEHRGKVVVLVWWATWCGPCMALIPHEKALAERYAGRPFAILGVNGDDNPARAKKAAAELGVTWRSWSDGGPEGPISTHWNVEGWPTVYVLDAAGVIRYKGHNDEAALDRAVEAAMSEASPRPKAPG